uniref:Uncharacterized protein YjbI, contains pentapeptide repeats n=1 Tax=Candidatus Kentrum sp. MB TaxID=2138164 RepID=A0A451B8T0_9GAMM|nr:MAG: Uncharacterized protein YjbI, contains pentapeptide repeats [Candidatus Kentron sp. MB]VFK74671.1 MAG: Uncharacterized protein YjbI, contains pentapeptide repeats [Candidatus Kentron sp. MB]
MNQPLSVLKKAPWVLYNLFGLRHVVEMTWIRKVNDPGYQKPPTFFLWVIGLYAALFGIASTNYEAALDRAENRMGALVSQLSTGNDEAFKNLIEQIPRVQRMETPLEPDLLWPFQGHPWRASFFSCRQAKGYLNAIPEGSKGNQKYFLPQSLFCKRANPDILQWTKETIGTWKGRLAGMDLRRIDLSRASLAKANLSGANLLEANLSGALLSQANLSGTELLGASLSGAEAGKADLSGAELWGADLSGARLEGADLSGTHLWKANLTGAELWGANLSRTEFRKANLSRANLFETQLGGIKGWKAIASIRGANILGVKEAPEGFRAWALENGAVEMTLEEWWAVDWK